MMLGADRALLIFSVREREGSSLRGGSPADLIYKAMRLASW